MIFMTTFDWILLTVIVGITCAMLITYMDHRRKMAMIGMNIKLEEPYKQWHLLISGLSIAAIGLGLLIGFLQIAEQSQLINAKEPGFITSLVLLTFGGALTASHYLSTQRRITMKALLERLKSFKEGHTRIEIKLTDGSSYTGPIRDIIDEELLELEVPGQTQPSLIPIDKVVSIRRI